MISIGLTDFGVATWLTCGAALGVAAMAVMARLRAWRQTHLASEWDPY